VVGRGGGGGRGTDLAMGLFPDPGIEDLAGDVGGGPSSADTPLNSSLHPACPPPVCQKMRETN
jgi:hypothetical protein